MPRYNRSYDYGLRGYNQANRFRGRGSAARGYDQPDYGRGRPLPNRVTARYNMDYVTGNRGERYPTNPNTFTGDREDRVGDLRYFRTPYTTIGGTRTYRGASEPFGYDRDYFSYDRNFFRGG